MRKNQRVAQIINAIKSDNLQELGQLLNEKENDGGNFEEANQFVQSQIVHLCAQYNAHQICRFIVSQSEFANQINNRDIEGKTPLHVCSIFGSVDCARVLLDNGAQVDALKRGDWTALMNSVAKSDLELVRLLLHYGADLCLCNKDGWTAMALATRTGNADLFALLEEHAQLNHHSSVWSTLTKNGRTLLHIAAIHNHLHLAKRFLTEPSLKRYFNVNAKDACGVTPFMDAAVNTSPKMCQLLWRHFDGTFNVNQADNSGRAALHMAAQANSISVIKYLVEELKCDIDLKDNWNQTPLFLAAREGHEAAAKLLLQLGAKQTLDAKNRSLLEIAQQYRHSNLVPHFSGH